MAGYKDDTTDPPCCSGNPGAELMAWSHYASGCLLEFWLDDPTGDPILIHQVTEYMWRFADGTIQTYYKLRGFPNGIQKGKATIYNTGTLDASHYGTWESVSPFGKWDFRVHVDQTVPVYLETRDSPLDTLVGYTDVGDVLYTGQ